MSRLTIRIVGADADNGNARLDVLVAFCDATRKCLRRTEEMVSGDKAMLEYRIVDMSVGSALLEIEPITKDPESESRGEWVPFEFVNRVAAIEAGSKEMERMTSDDLAAFGRLAAPLDKQSAAVQIGHVQITESFKQNIKRRIATGFESEGSFKGTIEQLNVHDGFRFTIYSTPGVQARCTFSPDLLPQVKRSIKRSVTVYGTFQSDPSTGLPVTGDVHAIEIHPDASELPTAKDLRGSIEPTVNIDAVDYVRQIRDSEPM